MSFYRQYLASLEVLIPFYSVVAMTVTFAKVIWPFSDTRVLSWQATPGYLLALVMLSVVLVENVVDA
jgi:hypothetical protein